MQNLITILKKYLRKPHVHNYSTIIASMYSSFNYRRVVVQCKCGERKIALMHHDSVFPFPTSIHITYKELKELCHRNQVTK